MTYRNAHRGLCAVLSLALALTPLLSHATEHMRCDSQHMRYQYCPAETKNHVKLVHKNSFMDCTEGRSWGFDHHGVWVDHGCSADFEVGEDQDKNKNMRKTAAIGAAVLGLAALAAISNSHSKSAEQQGQPAEAPSWAIGNFGGRDDFEHTQVELHVSPGGALTGRANGHAFTGQVKGNLLEAGRHKFRIERKGNGFMARDDNNSDHQVWFQRTGSDEPGGY